MIGGFRSVLCVSLFQGKAKNAIVIVAFELKSSHVCEKHSKVSVQSVRFLDQAGSMDS